LQHFHFSFVGQSFSREHAEKHLQENEKIKVDPNTLQIREIKNPATEKLIQESQKQIDKSRDYLEQLEDFYRETELICAEFETKNPYSVTVEKALQSKKLSPDENDELQIFIDFAQNAPTLSLIRKFLIDLPEGKQFDDLRFAKNLLEINLNLPQILKNPDRLDKSVVKAFEDFRKLYARKYLQFLQKRTEFLKNFWRDNEKVLQQKILAARTLAAIPFFRDSAGEIEKIEAEFENLKTKFRSEVFDEKIVRQALKKEPFFKSIKMTEEIAEKVCGEFVEKLDKFLSEHFAQIRTKSVLGILNSSKKSSIQKLSKLLQISKLEKIVPIFNQKTADAIGHELKKILSPESVDVLRLGDFSTKLEKIETDADVEKLITNFQQFLKRKKQETGNLILK
jgi:hypothetical protein